MRALYNKTSKNGLSLGLTEQFYILVIFKDQERSRDQRSSGVVKTFY